MNYQNLITEIWRHYDLENATNDYTNLVRYATMAASSHNTQPWKFKLVPGRILILPDLTRRCSAVDPDDHHLFASLGCALANLAEACSAAGLRSHSKYDEASSSLVVDLDASSISRSELFDAIPKRQCSRTTYDGSEISARDLKLLEDAGTGNGVSVMLFTGKSNLSKIAEYVVEGNIAQMNDPEWIDELKFWIRFNGKHAVKSGDGLYGRSMGSPDAPKWIGNLILRFALTAENQNKKDLTNILSSSGVAVFVSDHENQAYWIEAGRCYERFALQAEALNLRTAFINPPVEVRELRSQFASWLGIGERRPDLVVRFGRGPRMPPSLRRPVEEVIIK
jgi:hypothetical protein